MTQKFLLFFGGILSMTVGFVPYSSSYPLFVFTFIYLFSAWGGGADYTSGDQRITCGSSFSTM